VKGRSGQQVTMSINKLLDVEEHIWSPNYGLKGNVDATIQVTVNEGVESRILTVPFELKTGKRVSENHFAQTALYTLLISDRYDVEVTDGILYYMETSQTSRVQAVRQELIHMIMKRNELACFVRERLKLPEMLPESRQRLCNNCYAQPTCYLYHKLAEDGTSDTIANKGKYEELVKYLKPADQDFFKKWDHLLTKEETEMKKFTRELWTMLSEQREKLGRCFGNVVIEPGSASELAGASKINRYGYTFTKQFASSGFSFAESQITIGEPIVVSDEKGHYALANGYVTQVSKRRITVAVDRSLHNARTRKAGFHSQNNQDFIGALEMNNRISATDLTQDNDAEPVLYRLDKDEFANGMATARNNMLQIMNDTVFKAVDLRAAIVNNREPRFKSVASAISLPSQSWQGDMNSDQRAAVEIVMAAQDYALVLGMPGTGKTTTIAHIIRALVAKGKSVLLTSYTHTAVDNILLKVRHAGFDVLRLGVLAKIHPEVQEFAILASQQKESLQEVQDSWCNPPVVATTCLGINHPLFAKRTFDYCIVDEASQITLPVCLGPLRMAKTFILVGDHFQLPPLVQNKEALEGGLDMSLFRMLSEGHADAVVTLEHQYRMSEDVMLLSNKLIYSGRLKCGNSAVASRSLKIPDPNALANHHFSTSPGSMASQLQPNSPCPGPSSPSCHLSHTLNPENKVLFFSTDTLLPLSAENVNGNRITNPLEGALVTQFVHLFLSAGISASEIGVITFYRSQLALLRQNLRSATSSSAGDRGAPAGRVELHTADKFQGRDKEVVIVSFVRSNNDGQVGELLKDCRRVNVALTRARSKLVLIGSKKTLLQGGEVLKGMVDVCEEKGWLRDLDKGAGDGHLFSEMIGSQFDPLSPVLKRKPVEVGKSPSKRPQSSPSKRRVLGEVEGNIMRGRVPKKSGKMGKKGLLGNRPVLRDIVNDVL
jgi:DNA replication ATP-dependent helicase Dna2